MGQIATRFIFFNAAKIIILKYAYCPNGTDSHKEY